MLPLVMIPALGCDAGLYEPVAEGLRPLARPRTLVVAEPTLEACVSRVLSEVEGAFIIAGTSFGGYVALETALAAPDRVRGLWIMGSSAGATRDPAGARTRGIALRDGRFESVVTGLADAIAHLPGPRGEATRNTFLAMARQMGPEPMARQNEALAARQDRWGDLPRIACPVLLLWGREDQFTPASDGLRMAGLLPDARYAEIRGCGHLPTLEAPEEVVGIATHWLRERVG
ncbi:MAG: alpha/beta fold hydrolase [Parvibaculaceae bacterium]